MIQHLFPAKKNIIDNFQNMNALFLSSYMSYLYFKNDMEYSYLIIFSYLTFDLLFSKNDAFVHHIFGILLSSIFMTCGITNTHDRIALSEPLVKTEISTIFLLFRIMMEEKAPEMIKKNVIVKTLYKINDFIFIATFVKFRIFDLYFNIIKNEEYHNTLSKYYYDNNGQYFFWKELQFYIGILGLYSINIYWFSLICKKLYKKIVIPTFPQINTDKFAERILPWTMFLSVVPYVQQKTYNKYDFAGITMLTFASNLYHSRKRNILNSHDEVLISNNVMINGLKDDEKDASMEFFFNTGAIHLKSLLSLIAMGSNRGNTSAIIHFVFFIGAHIYSIQPIQIASTDTNYMKILNTCVIIPALYDLFNIICLIDDRAVQTQIALTIMAIGIVINLKPLYKLNHLAIHFLIILQTWHISNAIINVSKRDQ